MDKSGNCYISGEYWSRGQFDTTNLTGTGYSNIYLAKYLPSGKLIYVKHNTTGHDAAILNMCIDNSGHIYLVGQFEGNFTLGTFYLPSDVGIFSYFVAKYDTSGNCLWVRPFNNHYGTGNYDIRVTCIACDNNDSVYIYGHSDGSSILDGIHLDHTMGKLFFAKLNPATGTALWAQQIQASYLTVVQTNKIAVDANNNIIVSGTFGDNLSITPGLFCVFNTTDTLMTGLGNARNLFISKYDVNGNYLWAKQIDSFAYNDYAGMSSDQNNNIFVVGTEFYAKYNTNGERKWIHYLADMPIVIATNKFGNYICDYGGNLYKTDTGSGNIEWNLSSLGIPSIYSRV